MKLYLGNTKNNLSVYYGDEYFSLKDFRFLFGSSIERMVGLKGIGDGCLLVANENVP